MPHVILSLFLGNELGESDTEKHSHTVHTSILGDLTLEHC